MGFLSRLFGSDRPREGRWDTAPVRPVFSVLDVETTGLSPRSDRVLELAIVRLDGRGNVVDEWSSRFNPQGPVGASHIHGITDADVVDAPLFGDLVALIVSRLAGTVLVAHNAQFDLGFLRGEFDRAGWTWPHPSSLCTLRASWHYSPALSRRRLADCCAESGVTSAHAHSALGDARAAASLLANWLRRHPVYPDLDPALSRSVSVEWPAAASHPARTTPSAAPTGTSGTAKQRWSSPKPKAPALGSMLSKVTFDISAADSGDIITDERIRVGSYLEKLTEAVADGVLTDEEVSHLADLASLYDLDETSVETAHLAIIEGLAQIAVLDSKISTAERAELRHLATRLGLSEEAVKVALADRRAAHLRMLASALPALPQSWSLGEPLRLGDKVAFTGGDPATRARLEDLTAHAGIEVMPTVSRFTKLLVSDGTPSTKTGAADKHGVRTVTYEAYQDLLRWRQPPL